MSAALLLGFVRQIANLIGGQRSRLDPVSLTLKIIYGNVNTPCSDAEKAANINSDGLDFAVRRRFNVLNLGDAIAVFVIEIIADNIVPLQVRDGVLRRSGLLGAARLRCWLSGLLGLRDLCRGIWIILLSE